MMGDPVAWKRMEKYAKQDVVLLEKVYLKMRPWMKNHPNLALYTGGGLACPNCNSYNVMRRGYSYAQTQAYQRWQCKDCGKYSQSVKRDLSKEKPELK